VCRRKQPLSLAAAPSAEAVYFTLLFHGNGRSHKELESRFGSSLERMAAVTDRHSAPFALLSCLVLRMMSLRDGGHFLGLPKSPFGASL